jgi:hypothetical protein
MTGYESIDPILMAWRGSRVYASPGLRRAINRDELSGEQRHMWLDPLDDNGMVRIRAAKSEVWKRDRSVSLAELENALDEAYDALMRA